MATASVEIEAAREPGSGLGLALLRRSPDAALVRRASRGDRQAFAVIFERYSGNLYRYCVSILRNPDDAADALQAAMESALKAIEAGGDSPRQLRPWLYRIAHNESISTIRRRRAHVELESLELESTHTTEGAAALRARINVLFSDLRDLPESRRGALLMRELSGLSYEEIGVALSVSPAAAKQAVYEARLALHEVEEGRQMLCADARAAISDGDGRRLQGRKVRAHLRSCPACAAFRDAIRTRRADLAAIPPLGAAAGAGLLASILGVGGGGGTGGSGAILAAGGLGSALTAKGVAVVATGAIIVGTAGVGVTRSDSDRGEDARGGAAGRAAAPGDTARTERGSRPDGASGLERPDARSARQRGGTSPRRTETRRPGLDAASPAPVPAGGGGGAGSGNVTAEEHPAQTGLAIAESFRPDQPAGQSPGKATEGLETAGGARDGAGLQDAGRAPTPPESAQSQGSAGSGKQVAESITGGFDLGRVTDRAGGR